jgi:import inner membrane translocase subunit TIM16
MAHRIITQMAFTGARVLGRAFTEAYKQASASQVHPITFLAVQRHLI